MLRRGLDLCTVSGREMVSGSKVRMSNSLQSQMTPLPASMKSHRVTASLRCSIVVVEVLRCIEQRNFGDVDRPDVRAVNPQTASQTIWSPKVGRNMVATS